MAAAFHASPPSDAASNRFRWRCIRCDRLFRPCEVGYACPSCGRTVVLDMEPDYRELRRLLSRETLAVNREATVWRYAALMPLLDEEVRHASALASIPVGWTPLVAAPKLGNALGVAGGTANQGRSAEPHWIH